MHANPTPSSLAMLTALQARKVYEGTVSAKTVRSRRAANKAATKSRRINRKRAA